MRLHGWQRIGINSSQEPDRVFYFAHRETWPA
jgi:hypothetical protein